MDNSTLPELIPDWDSDEESEGEWGEACGPWGARVPPALMTEGYVSPKETLATMALGVLATQLEKFGFHKEETCRLLVQFACKFALTMVQVVEGVQLVERLINARSTPGPKRPLGFPPQGPKGTLSHPEGALLPAASHASILFHTLAYIANKTIPQNLAHLEHLCGARVGEFAHAFAQLAALETAPPVNATPALLELRATLTRHVKFV